MLVQRSCETIITAFLLSPAITLHLSSHTPIPSPVVSTRGSIPTRLESRLCRVFRPRTEALFSHTHGNRTTPKCLRLISTQHLQRFPLSAKRASGFRSLVIVALSSLSPSVCCATNSCWYRLNTLGSAVSNLFDFGARLQTPTCCLNIIVSLVHDKR